MPIAQADTLRTGRSADHDRGVQRRHRGDRHRRVDSRHRCSGRIGFSAARRSRRSRCSTRCAFRSPPTPCSTGSRTARSCESACELVSRDGYDLRIGTSQVGTRRDAALKASKDTAATPVVVTPLSKTPTDQLFLSAPLADFTHRRQRVDCGDSAAILASAAFRRVATFLRFNVPSRHRGLDDDRPRVAVVDAVAEPAASTRAIRSVVFPLACSRRRPSPTSQRCSQFVGSDRRSSVSTRCDWRRRQRRAFVRDRRARRTSGRTKRRRSARARSRCRSGAEGQLPAQIDFFSTQGPLAAVRPRLRITYVPQTSYGLP